ncbi:hypothetical protein BDV95DRAFT_589797 [Massariosphaeria phaeospora]|uniref:Uncharacterized protein n=1 Tax=Massariosphaeria phaeospora TaxID=100035 RepID=A0A7C8MCS2_9PLEO|nr:hypothetical protein BDV95DRAFT_589797 [Massariosphaeria phaeospora]
MSSQRNASRPATKAATKGPAPHEPTAAQLQKEREEKVALVLEKVRAKFEEIYEDRKSDLIEYKDVYKGLNAIGDEHGQDLSQKAMEMIDRTNAWLVDVRKTLIEEYSLSKRIMVTVDEFKPDEDGNYDDVELDWRHYRVFRECLAYLPRNWSKQMIEDTLKNRRSKSKTATRTVTMKAPSNSESSKAKSKPEHTTSEPQPKKSKKGVATAGRSRRVVEDSESESEPKPRLAKAKAKVAATKPGNAGVADTPRQALDDATNVTKDVKAVESKAASKPAPEKPPQAAAPLQKVGSQDSAGAKKEKAAKNQRAKVGDKGVAVPVAKKVKKGVAVPVAKKNQMSKAATVVVDDDDTDDKAEGEKPQPKKTYKSDEFIVDSDVEEGEIQEKKTPSSEAEAPRPESSTQGGGSSTSKEHGRSSASSANGTKRKRMGGEDDVAAARQFKRVAIGGRNIARPRTRLAVPAPQTDISMTDAQSTSTTFPFTMTSFVLRRRVQLQDLPDFEEDEEL